MRYGHLQGLQGGKISWASRGMLMDQSASSRGGGPDSSAHERVNPRGASCLFLSTRANSSSCVASSGSKSEVVWSLWVGTPIGSSTLGLGDEALSADVAVMGSFLPTSNMSRSHRSPLSSGESRHPWSFLAESHRTLVSISDLSVQVCSVWAKTRIFFCLTVQKSLALEASLWDMKSQGHSLLSQGGASHQSKALFWARGSLNATISHRGLLL